MKEKLKHLLSHQLRISSTQGVLRSQLIADKLNVNSTDLESMEILMREGRMTSSELAMHTGLTRGAATGIADRLVKAGFAVRERDENDRRKVYVSLVMDKIYNKVVPLYESLSQSIDAFMESRTEKELETVLKFLEELNEISQRDLAQLRKNDD